VEQDINNQHYLQKTSFLEKDNAAIIDFIKDIDRNKPKKDQAIELYYLVRDHFLYDPYHLDLRPVALKASEILKKRRAWCVEKAIVMATCLRTLGIPSRLGYGIVINHIGVEKLTAYLQRKEIVFHGYVEALLDGKWVKSTPAFDKKVCRISGVPPLDWDGEHDAMFQAYKGSEKFMEYVHFYGHFDDVPVELMNQEMKKYYPHLFEKEYDSREFSFFHC
jgi:transglutaminase-like putative cysteine protease